MLDFTPIIRAVDIAATLYGYSLYLVVWDTLPRPERNRGYWQFTNGHSFVQGGETPRGLLGSKGMNVTLCSWASRSASSVIAAPITTA